jgi:STE24 endopeptidase
MFPVLLLITAVVAAMAAQGLGPEDYPTPYPGAMTALAYTLAFSLAPLVLGQIDHLRIRRRLGRPDASWEGLSKLVARARGRLRLSVVLGYGLSLAIGHWAELLARAGLERWILVDEFLLLLPFFLSVTGSWVQEHRITALVHLPVERLRSALAFRARLVTIPILPLGLIAAGKDVVVLSGLEGEYLCFEYLGWATLIVFIVALFTLSPFLVRLVLRTRPLPAGELRRSLEALSGRIGFRCREILVWDTGGRFLNAAIVGLSPRLRYVVFTDLLIDRLPAPEVEAVFAHEAAHGVSFHAPLYLLLSILFVLVAFPLSANLPGDDVAIAAVLAAAIFFVYWFLLFGYVSRRAEREADLFGARAVGKPEWLIGALERIAFLSGERKRFSAWRHFSTERRIATLRRFQENPRLFDRARRARRTLAACVIVTLVVSGALAIREVPLQHTRGRVQLALYEGNLERLDQAAEEGIERYPDDPWFVFMKGIGAAERRRDREAIRSFRRALSLDPDAELEAAIRAELRDLGLEP